MDPADRSHPDSEELERFMRGKLPRPEVPAVVRHLLTGCPRCLEVTRRLWSLGHQAPRGLLVLVGGTHTALAASGGDGRRRGVR